MFTGRTPDLTLAQLTGLALAIGGAAVSFGIVPQRDKPLAVFAAFVALAIVLKACDAYIRGKRAQALMPRATVTVTPASSSSSSEPPPSSSAAATVQAPPPPPAPATVVTVTGSTQGWQNVTPAGVTGVVVRG